MSESAPPDAGAAASGSRVLKTQEACDRPVSHTGYMGSQRTEFAYVKYSYELVLGGHYDGHSRLPLVVVFHGDWMTGSQIRAWLSLEWESGGNAIFIYPDSPTGTWDSVTAAGLNASAALVDALVTDVSTKYCVDANRIFAWGISRGGFLANYLGCYRGDTFRGIISNSGGGPSPVYPMDASFSCPTQPVTALVIHGNADETIGFGSGLDSATYWAAANGCNTTATATQPGPCVSYDGCRQPVIWCPLGGWPHKLWSPSMHAAWQLIESTADD